MTDHTTLEAPNLDAMTVEDLAVFQKNALLLAKYARFKINAMMARKAGEIESALAHERHCEAIYGLLPLEMRW
jgi:hypothetical protein